MIGDCIIGDRGDCGFRPRPLLIFMMVAFIDAIGYALYNLFQIFGVSYLLSGNMDTWQFAGLLFITPSSQPKKIIFSAILTLATASLGPCAAGSGGKEHRPMSN